MTLGERVMISETTHQAFYDGKRSETLPLVVNDVVTVKEGKKSGAIAWVISIQEEKPEPKYLVEYEDGSDEILPLTKIELR